MGALRPADVGEGWPVLETFEWMITANPYALDSLRRRLERARESEKRFGSLRFLKLTRHELP